MSKILELSEQDLLQAGWRSVNLQYQSNDNNTL